MNPRVRVIAATAVLVVAFGSIVLHSLGRRSPTQPPVAWTPAPVGWADDACWFSERWQATCGWLWPATQDEAQDTTLPVVILRRSAAAPSRHATIYLAGGPGGSSYLYEEAMAGWIEWRDRLGLDHDLVLYDARGSGYADPELVCEGHEEVLRAVLVAPVETPEQNDALWRDYEANVHACAERVAKIDRAARLYSTPVHARDLLQLVRELRRQFAYDTVALYGVSYGSRLAVEAAAEAAPYASERIDRIVLDSYYMPGSNLEVRTLKTWQEVLLDFEDYCKATPTCARRSVALRDQVVALLGSPAAHAGTLREVDLGDFVEGDPQVGLLIDPESLIEMLMHAFAADLAPEQLPLRVEEALAGRWTPQWEELATSYAESALDWSVNPVAHDLTECADTGEFTPQEAARMSASAPELASVLMDVPTGYGYCSRLGVTPAPLKPRTVDIDALVVAKQLDPITPWRVAETGLPHLPKAAWRLVRGAGHGVADSDECAARAIGAYLNSGDRSGWDGCDLVDSR